MAQTIVQKYGGSSVADPTRLRQVAAAVVKRKRAGERLVVVVSAMGKTTDALIEQARLVSPDPPRRELDMLVTAGERISMALLSMAIHEAGEDAISFTGSQCGIITDESHQNARILEVRPYRIAEELDRDRIVIVAGYQGVSRQKEITTLGRGGSDTTAVALAAALGAAACEIYSDVDGVYTADPGVCEQAQHLREISYETMQTMAGAGAKVLNAEAVEMAKRAGIAICARKTGDPSGRETVVHAAAPERRGVTAVVGATHVTRMQGPAASVPDLVERIVTSGGRPMSLKVGEDFDLLVDRTGIPGREHAVVVELARAANVHATPVAAVTLVGNGLVSRLQEWRHIVGAIKDCGLAPMAWLAGDAAHVLVVPVDSCDETVRALHLRLVAG